MFAPLVAKAQTKDPDHKPASQCSAHAAPCPRCAADQRSQLQRAIGNQAMLRFSGKAAAVGMRFVTGQEGVAPQTADPGTSAPTASPGGGSPTGPAPPQAQTGTPDPTSAGPTAAGQSAGAGTTCADGTVDQTQDALPAVPGFNYQIIPGPAVFDAVKQREPATTGHPLGASYPAFDQGAPVPVKVTTAPDTGNNCLKCMADWTLPAFSWVSYVSKDYVVSDEPARFPVSRAGDVAGCPPSALPHLTEVRIQIPPALVPKIVAGEGEHYADWVRSYQMAGGRLLGNTRRLTPDRTHLRGADQAACEAKVADFLAAAAGSPPPAQLAQENKLTVSAVQKIILDNYGDKLFPRNVSEVYAQSGRVRDVKGGPHHAADPTPPLAQAPISPNIDMATNPFGCEAYARRYNAQSLPGIPGQDAKTVVTDLGLPPKQAWHAL